MQQRRFDSSSLNKPKLTLEPQDAQATLRVARASPLWRKVTMSASQKLPPFDQIKSVHIIGVCGTLMGAFAAFLKRRKIHVTGSDQNIYPPMSDVLRDAGVELFTGYRPENILEMKARPDLVVIGNVIPASNPEAKAAIEKGYAYTSLPEAMEKLLLGPTRNLVVAGTHGKTTTSSMLAHVLVQAGEDPSYFIGGVSQDLPFSFNVGNTASGRPFVLEGDEYDTAFWDKVPKFNHYLPNDTILTSVEYDHADIYADIEAVYRAFEGLISRIRSNGRLIACLDYPLVEKLTKLAKVPVITYASRPGTSARFTVGAHKCSFGLDRVPGVWTRFSENFSRPPKFPRCETSSGSSGRDRWSDGHRRFCSSSDGGERNSSRSQTSLSEEETDRSF
jgi:UDP-N-acetylmuramoylalanine-D-glutamate ligase